MKFQAGPSASTGAVMAKLNLLLAQPGAKRILITPDGKVRRLDPRAPLPATAREKRG